MHRFKTASFTVLLLNLTIFLGGCTATVTPEEITAGYLMALVASWGVLGIVLGILGVIFGILWMLMPFFVWRIARHNKRTAARALSGANSLNHLEELALRMERSLKQMASVSHEGRGRQS